MKNVGDNWYYCPGCKQKMLRTSFEKSIRSYCEKVGKPVTMKIIKPQPQEGQKG